MIVGFECKTVGDEFVMGNEITCENFAVFEVHDTYCCFACARACIDAAAFERSELRYIA